MSGAGAAAPWLPAAVALAERLPRPPDLPTQLGSQLKLQRTKSSQVALLSRRAFGLTPPPSLAPHISPLCCCCPAERRRGIPPRGSSAAAAGGVAAHHQPAPLGRKPCRRRGRPRRRQLGWVFFFFPRTSLSFFAENFFALFSRSLSCFLFSPFWSFPAGNGRRPIAPPVILCTAFLSSPFLSLPLCKIGARLLLLPALGMQPGSLRCRSGAATRARVAPVQGS